MGEPKQMIESAGYMIIKSRNSDVDDCKSVSYLIFTMYFTVNDNVLVIFLRI
jgi:hypothetical protein